MKNTEYCSITLRSLLVVIALISAMILAGCSTWRGFGEDTESVGESIQESSR